MNIPKRRKPTRSGIRDDTGPIRCPGHLKWVRGHECAIAGKEYHGLGWYSPWPGVISSSHECTGKIEAHHVREGDHGHGMGQKPDDSTAVPLCSAAHKRGHDKGWQTFEKEWRVNLEQIASDLWKASPHGQKYRREHNG